MTLTMTDLRIGSLFSGYGGLDLAAEAFFGARTAWHVEYDAGPSKVLAVRWPGVPNHGDVTTVDWAAVEPVDIVTGGFPCQDLSLAGRRAGMRPGSRSGLWGDFKKAIDVLQPQVVIIENVRGLLSGCAESDSGPCKGCVGDGEHRPPLRALGRVLLDLDELGFDAEWTSLRASDVGAPHGRFRVFVLAYRPGVGREWGGSARRGRVGSENGGDAALKMLPTPQAHDRVDGKTPEQVARARAKGYGVRNLNEVVVNELLPTPTTDPMAGNGHARHLGGEVALLPTPAAMNPNDEEDLDTWRERRERRERVKRQKCNGNGFGTPLGVAVRLMPTPQVADATGGHATRSGDRADELLLPGLAARIQEESTFGPYARAVQRWERLTREAPAPTLPDGKGDRHRLNARFAEWMMGLPAGWVTDVLERRAALKALGNGVVPQQAHAALGILWARVDTAMGVAA